MGENVLLAGCGDLGSRVAQRLLARGDRVWALRRTPPGDADQRIQWLR
ncbi:MAG: SDR family NAD(P)-dependent oxidoreductase, partial [Rhodanobacter sp.]